MKRTVNAAGEALLKSSEELKLTAYLDPVGILTVGWGHVVHPDDNLDLGDEISEAHAEDLFESDISQAELGVQNAVTTTLTDNQFAALVDLAFNIGVQAFAHSTLCHVVNIRSFADVPSELRKWVYSKGKKLNGLVVRREAEIALFNTPDK